MTPTAKPAAVTKRKKPNAALCIGLGITLLITLTTFLGGLNWLERPLLDRQFRWFAKFNPTPTDRIVHIDIDDTSLKRTGRWPWPRTYLAHVVDELNRAGAKSIGFDLLLIVPQPVRYIADKKSDSDVTTAITQINDDANLASAMKRGGNVMLPINFADDLSLEPLSESVMKVLDKNLLLDDKQISEQLSLSARQGRQIRNQLSSLKSQVIRRKLKEMASNNQPLDFATARKQLLSNLPDYVSSSVTLDLLKTELDHVRAMLALGRDLPELKSMSPDARRHNLITPINLLAEQSQSTGYVTYEPEFDGVVRTIQLWIDHEPYRYPHFALALACHYLNVPIDKVTIQGNETIIPDATMPDGSKQTIRLPMLPNRAGSHWHTNEHWMLVPWQTNAPKWDTLFDPQHKTKKQHFPIGPLVEIVQLENDIQSNERQADLSLLQLGANEQIGGMLNPDRLNKYDQLIDQLYKMGQKSQARQKLITQRNQYRKGILDTINFLKEDLDQIDKLTADELKIKTVLNRQLDLYHQAINRSQAGQKTIHQLRQQVKQLVNGRICLIGWTATGSLADFVPTSLNAKSPGVVVHGALLNAILTNHFIRRAPLWIDLLVVFVIGSLVSLIATRFPPISAMIMLVGFGVTYFLLNGYLIFDYANVWANTSGPLSAGVLSWAGVIVYRLFTEQRERMRITRQFKNYVSPDLVDYLVQHPHLVKMEGENKELTCLFTDIAGFTTISQKLGPEQTAKLLNRYLSIATEQLMDHRATVNKYLGDGIMAFWGAPIDNKNHATDCCLSVLSCIQALKQLEDEPMLQGLPTLFLRVGIATGQMMIGDFGAPPQRSDYTVIGDSVNLAARLESANKQFDTQMLISDRTYELVKDQMLLRPIAKMVVVGRDIPERTWELMNTQEAATQKQHQLADATTEAVEAYYAGNFDQCTKLFNQMNEQFGPCKLHDRYIAACVLWQSGQAEGEFDGSIVLTSK